MSDIKGYYRLLDIHINATFSEIKLAYRRKAKELHPDKNLKTDTTEKFQQLNEAYEILSNAESKKNYDNGFDDEVKSNFRWYYQYRSNDTNAKVDIETLKCTCSDWKENRSKFPSYDPRRLCSHLVSKLIKEGLTEDFKPFEEYLKNKKANGLGVTLSYEIIFLKSSVIMINYSQTTIYMMLRKHTDSFLSYQIFVAYKYQDIGYKWIRLPYNVNDVDILYKDNIDGKDYINKRFNILNCDVPLCNHLYIYHKMKEENRKKQEYITRYKIQYDTAQKQLKFNSRYTTHSFHKKLKEMGFILKNKELNNNNWILHGDGLYYGINYISSVYTSTVNIDVPSWYISTYYNENNKLFQNKVQTSRIIKKTNIMWNKKKFDELLEVMDNYYTPLKDKGTKEKTTREQTREEWLKNVSCHTCASKNIHKKDKRQRKGYKVQRYQCMDCKSIFQEKIDEVITSSKEKNKYYIDIPNEL